MIDYIPKVLSCMFLSEVQEILESFNLVHGEKKAGRRPVGNSSGLSKSKREHWVRVKNDIGDLSARRKIER